MKFIVFCLVDDIDLKKAYLQVSFNLKKLQKEVKIYRFRYRFLNWNQEKKFPARCLLGSTTNWATKPHIGSEANFNMININ